MPLDFGSQDVSTTSDPDAPVEWSAPLPITLENGALAQLQFAPEFNPALPHEAAFQVGDTPAQPELTIDGRESAVTARVQTTAGDLIALGDGQHVFEGSMLVDAGDAAFPLQDARHLGEGVYELPIRMTANVSTPPPWGQIGLGAAAAALAVLAAAALYAMRPILKRDARLEAHGVPYDIGAVRSATVGGPADDVPLGLGSSLGTIGGRWGRGAGFEAARDGVVVSGDRLSAGDKVRLSDGDTITADGQTFTYADTKPDGQQ